MFGAPRSDTLAEARSISSSKMHPMRVTIPHYHRFGPERELVGRDLGSPASWDVLRVESKGSFGLPARRAEWSAEAAGREELKCRAAALDSLLRMEGVRRVASYGVGSAHLELLLHELDGARALVLTEYAPATLERLRSLLPEAEIIQHDLVQDLPLDAEIHLFIRIDTEFTDNQWRAVMRRFAGHQILFVAGGMVGLRGFARELGQRLKPGATRAGWVRTRAAVESLWEETHDAICLSFADLPAWLLRPQGRHTP